MNKEDMIYDLLQEQNKVSKKHREDDAEWKLKTHDRLGAIETDLRAHKEGNIAARDKNVEQDVRLDILEKPGIFWDTLTKKILWSGTLAGAIYGIYRLLTIGK